MAGGVQGLVTVTYFRHVDDAGGLSKNKIIYFLGGLLFGEKKITSRPHWNI